MHRPAASYSHIKVVSQEHLAEADPNTPPSPSPFLAKSSFQQDADAALSHETTLSTQPSIDSLASHAVGATFASKARAAELQAARARQELKRKSIDELKASEASESEEMPKRLGSRSKITWKKISLSDLPDGQVSKPELVKDNAWVAPLASRLGPRQDPSDSNLPPCDSALSATDHETAHFPDFHQPTGEYRTRATRFGQENNNPYNFEETHQYGDGNPGYEQTSWGISNARIPSGRPGHRPAMDASAPVFTFPSNRCTVYEELLDIYAPEDATEIGERIQAAGDTGYDTDLTQAVWYNPTQGAETSVTIPQASYFGLSEVRPNVPQLQARPPAFYPAVRGTRTDMNRRESNTDHSSEQGPPPLPALASSRTSTHCGEAQAYGAPQVTNSYQYDGTFSQAPPHQSSALVGEDDNLSWRNRRAPIVETSLPNTEESLDKLLGYRLNLDGSVWIDPELRPDPSNRYRPLPTLRSRPQPAPPNSNVESSVRTARHIARTELKKLRQRRVAEREALLAANFSNDPPPGHCSVSGATRDTPDPNDTAVELLLPAMMQLSTYRPGSRHFVHDPFYRMGTVPEWSVDHGPDADRSFFGGDWGTPPARVGRDPRYRGLFDERPSRGNAPEDVHRPGGFHRPSRGPANRWSGSVTGNGRWYW